MLIFVCIIYEVVSFKGKKRLIPDINCVRAESV